MVSKYIILFGELEIQNNQLQTKFGISKFWFILKEALLPFLIGLVFMIMSKYRQSSLNKILLNDALFDNHKISISIKDEMRNEFEKIVKREST